ncbi:ATP-binding protein [Faecalibacter bovis]|uniref:histidine kinase n=1 Tax=Faecalibacter bovis TaxID=2898187 RepID=A0ABX7XD30_9FLAO|nr:ATP-binding protein [Faecalibacter bovis]QTV05800.1 GAF domain-containing protein [Faecalibacter bovis]
MKLFQQCHEEQIHILNEINSQGYVIGVDVNSFEINFVSENITEILDNQYKINQIIGSDLKTYFQFNYDFHTILNKKEGEYIKETYTFNGKSYFVVVYHFQNHFYIEMEKDLNPNNYPTYDKYAESILFSVTKQENWQALVDSIKKITGYNRVLIYKFLEDNNGICITENVDEGFDSYLGLHFPEFDIPKQARDLYIKKRNRLVSDIDADRVSLVSKKTEPIDLTYSEFRALSKVHLKYLQNFKAAASFSVSIVVNGKLWGLVACQNEKPKHIPINLRLQCVSLTKLSRVSYVNFKYEEKIAFKERFNSLLVNLKESLLIEDDYNKIISNFDGMLKFSKADGVALYKDGKIFKFGFCPSDQEILSIKKWASDNEIMDLYVSNSFYKDYGDELNLSSNAAGVAFKFLTKSDSSFLIWTKKEFKSITKWAGIPEKNTTYLKVRDNLETLAPRTNFSIWEKITNKESKIWKEKDIQSIREIITLILETSHIKSLKIAELYSQLKEVNSELDSFTYTVSHDLRTPLSVMKLNCQLLQKNLMKEGLNQDKIKNVISEIDNLTFMMQEILNLSKAKKSEILVQEVHCEELINRIIYESKIYNNLPNTEVVVNELNPIFADKTMAYEIFLNVINNAIKYSAKAENPKVEISSFCDQNFVIYSIKDNGIGIKEADKDKMFKLFSRMSNTDGFRGNGVGLSIVQRMMERLDGSIEFESEENKGTNFILKFKLPE